MPTSGRPRRWITPEPALAPARSRSAVQALDERADGSRHQRCARGLDLHRSPFTEGEAPEVVVAADERLPSATGRMAITGLASGTRSTRSTEAQRTCLVTRVPGMASLPSSRQASAAPARGRCHAARPRSRVPPPACARAPRLLRGVVLVHHPPWRGLELFVHGSPPPPEGESWSRHPSPFAGPPPNVPETVPEVRPAHQSDGCQACGAPTDVERRGLVGRAPFTPGSHRAVLDGNTTKGESR